MTGSEPAATLSTGPCWSARTAAREGSRLPAWPHARTDRSPAWPHAPARSQNRLSVRTQNRLPVWPKKLAVRSDTATTRAAASGAAGTARLLIHEHKRPLVVVCTALINLDRFVLALAADANQSSGNRTAGRRERRARLIRARRRR